ncbi:iron-containing redox enzyme family protein [Nocardia terpenica]|uniref:iron-containing redox enzyme family protein n=1 Tax=Nocardia terpenica TaxID=455432 RepID=UPI00189488E4|nr:iron-containing redox enzyme family protein [Nocardia terpenica]MBF6059275.1 iron-containing redox enzyme family protein [Nocardia terpenica]MBF6103186.1 iron-containing redox enzyme family protein [Nocardia terpenica]MBF6110625.1 iron-containing redox enzyme family protein [Nocardia terpenica]MBF6116756.1 iron-containing redox enzyme family protein [Nocardia terpenica]
MSAEHVVTDPVATALPLPRGPVSTAVRQILCGDPPEAMPCIGTADPYGDDLQLALHMCYELHYHGFDSVHPDREWDPEVLRLRADLEDRFVSALRRDVAGGREVADELTRLTTEPAEAGGVAGFLCARGQWWHVREYFVHRSIYHHKEADPYAWVIPRLREQAKAALVAVEFDEFGGGRGDRVHARLFADLLAGAGLHPGYLHYLDAVPAPMLALVNMMSLFGLHARWRGALVGHFATVEITSPPASRLLVDTLRRLDADPACIRFYTEHVEADAVHEQVMRRDVIGDLLRQEPGLAPSVVFGIQATDLLEDHIARQLLDHGWRAGRTSLRTIRPAVGD